MKFKINKNISFSKENRPFIVAEISGNHNGNKKLFLKHIQEAHKHGADMIKIQTYEAEDITIRNIGQFTKIKTGIWKDKNLWDLYEKAKTPYSWHKDAFKLAKKLNILLFSTPFSIRSLKFLKKFNPKLYKVSSLEITDHNLINEIAKTKKPVIISTGASSINDIKAAVKIVEKYHKKIILMHCVSGYPTPLDQANLKSINYLKKRFSDYFIGLSDHTDGIDTSIGSISLGAKIIEKHFKISNKINSIDSTFSINSKQLRSLKNFVLNIHKSLGTEKKTIAKSEKQNMIFRRSIYSIRKINKGDRFNKKNVSCFRPKIGLAANKYFSLIGKKSRVNIDAFQPIKKKDYS